MRLSPKKTEHFHLKMTVDEKTKIAQLAAGRKKKSLTEYIVECAMHPPGPAAKKEPDRELADLLKDHIQKTEALQREQQQNLYIILQFCLYIASLSRSQEQVMKFYESVYQDALATFGKGGR